MTEQLMDDLNNEEHEALLLMSEHAIAPPLSPAAKAVLDTANTAYEAAATGAQGTAAAIRAAADQVVPPEQKTPWGSVIQAHAAELRIRNELLAIATELESTNG